MYLCTNEEELRPSAQGGRGGAGRAHCTDRVLGGGDSDESVTLIWPVSVQAWHLSKTVPRPPRSPAWGRFALGLFYAHRQHGAFSGRGRGGGCIPRTGAVLGFLSGGLPRRPVCPYEVVPEISQASETFTSAAGTHKPVLQGTAYFSSPARPFISTPLRRYWISSY